MDDHEQRVRERAYRIWQEQGCPEGQADAHWDLARELLAIEDNHRRALVHVDRDPKNPSIAADRAEPAGPAAAAASELPTPDGRGRTGLPAEPRSRADHPRVVSA